MNKPHRSFSIAECKVKASMLLKALNSNDHKRSMQAAKRFSRLAEFVNLSFQFIK